MFGVPLVVLLSRSSFLFLILKSYVWVNYELIFSNLVRVWHNAVFTVCYSYEKAYTYVHRRQSARKTDQFNLGKIVAYSLNSTVLENHTHSHLPARRSQWRAFVRSLSLSLSRSLTLTLSGLLFAAGCSLSNCHLLVVFVIAMPCEFVAFLSNRDKHTHTLEQNNNKKRKENHVNNNNIWRSTQQHFAQLRVNLLYVYMYVCMCLAGLGITINRIWSFLILPCQTIETETRCRRRRDAASVCFFLLFCFLVVLCLIGNARAIASANASGLTGKAQPNNWPAESATMDTHALQSLLPSLPPPTTQLVYQSTTKTKV